MASISYDEEADAGYFSVSGKPVVRTEEIAPNVLVDYDSEDHPVGVEVLSIRQRLGGGDPRSYILGLTEGLLSRLARHAA
jgi:uncharacterized protein YuzE